MNDLEMLNPSNWKPAKGYANGILASGPVAFLGGHIGWNGDQVFETDDFVGQIKQTLENIRDVLAEVGASTDRIVRMTWFITDKKEYLSRLPEIGQAYRSVMGKHFPAMTMVQVVALIEDRAKVEIEATAVL